MFDSVGQCCSRVRGKHWYWFVEFFGSEINAGTYSKISNMFIAVIDLCPQVEHWNHATHSVLVSAMDCTRRAEKGLPSSVQWTVICVQWWSMAVSWWFRWSPMVSDGFHHHFPPVKCINLWQSQVFHVHFFKGCCYFLILHLYLKSLILPRQIDLTELMIHGSLTAIDSLMKLSAIRRHSQYQYCMQGTSQAKQHAIFGALINSIQMLWDEAHLR